ncbi:MAG TPA: transcriptional repressor NrdR [Planctomycetaceae bacterium]|nr:transcriptional repressor NrdR [Planctomycetaceae bacterium]
MQCKRRYTTYERLEELAIKVVKKDGVREPFSREKIRLGLARACWKRPLSDDQIDTVVAEIESDVYANFETEIETQQLGEMVMEHLGRLDQVAYVRFASVYREFKDVHDFVEELEPILKNRRDNSF